jgi:hypothetical protein
MDNFSGGWLALVWSSGFRNVGDEWMEWDFSCKIMDGWMDG